MKVVDQESGKDLDPSGALAKQHWGQSGTNLSEEPPSKGSVHKARIVSIRAFGAFVELEGYRTNGLVHVSQVHCVWISVKQLYSIGSADLQAPGLCSSFWMTRKSLAVGPVSHLQESGLAYQFTIAKSFSLLLLSLLDCLLSSIRQLERLVQGLFSACLQNQAELH